MKLFYTEDNPKYAQYTIEHYLKACTHLINALCKVLLGRRSREEEITVRAEDVSAITTELLEQMETKKTKS